MNYFRWNPFHWSFREGKRFLNFTIMKPLILVDGKWYEREGWFYYVHILGLTLHNGPKHAGVLSIEPCRRQ